MTGIRRYRHPERSRRIFTALRESACMRRGKMMSWCCLTSGDECSAIKIEGYARNDDAREALSKLRGAFRHPERSEMSDVRSCKGKAVRTESKDLAPHHHFAFLISNFSFKRGFQTQSRSGTPPGLTLNPEPYNFYFLSISLHKRYNNLNMHTKRNAFV